MEDVAVVGGVGNGRRRGRKESPGGSGGLERVRSRHEVEK